MHYIFLPSKLLRFYIDTCRCVGVYGTGQEFTISVYMYMYMFM